MQIWPSWVEATGGGLYSGSTAAAYTWSVWLNQTSASSYPIQPYQAAAWNTWIQQPTTGFYPQPQAQIWLGWQNTVASGTILAPGFAPPPAPPPPTAAELAIRRRHELIGRNRNRAHTARAHLARRKAEALLLEHLNDRQREDWLAKRSFTIHTADGKRTYRIAYGVAGNVVLVAAAEKPLSKHGHPISVGARFCMHVYHPDGPIPAEDNVLAQKLLIEADEGQFLALANVS